MKLETEADNTLSLYSSVERQNGEKAGGGAAAIVGCSTRGRDRAPFAHVTSQSIGTCSAGTEREYEGLGRGTEAADGAAQDINGFHATQKVGCLPSSIGQSALCFTSLNCEHFKFIDEDDDSSDVSPTSEESNSAQTSPPNGTSKETNNGAVDGIEAASNGDYGSQNGHLQEYDSEKQVEVSGFNDTSHHNGSSNSISDMSEVPNGTDDKRLNGRQLKSVLKKTRSIEKSEKRARVTFDESVTLYTDEFDDVQFLALRSAAEVNCTEVFYMFEPPIEYQDLLPFEPPDEYRDPENSAKENDDENKLRSNLCHCHSDNDNSSAPDTTNQPEEVVLVIEEHDSNSSCTTDGADVGKNEEIIEDVSGIDKSSEQQADHKEESERLFERFLEAEREFAEDDELNRVFHVLENDLVGDEKGDTFDDNFFKKLIGLLSAVEGDVQVQQGDFFTTTDFTVNEEDLGRDIVEEDDTSQAHSRTVSEADSDCSVSSQDTIIVRLGDEDGEQHQRKLCRQSSESDPTLNDTECVDISKDNDQKDTELSTEGCDEVFSDPLKTPSSESSSFDESQDKVPPRDQTVKSQTSKSESSASGEDISVQNTPKDTVQDADDSTSSDSRSGEVEEDIRLDDIGYDEEDADDYDEECLRGMVRGNSKIRRIIKKNALQCTLFRGLEARRRQQSGSKYQRPKSPPLSQESLVEQLKWLTTVDDNKDMDSAPNFCQKPPDVILSTGSVPINGNLPHCVPENEFSNHTATPYRLPIHYSSQPRHLLATDNQGTYIIQQTGYPVPHSTRHPKPWLTPANQVLPSHQRPQYSTPRAIVHPMPSQLSYPDDRLAAASPIPRDCRDWRVIQRVVVNRDNGNFGPQVSGNFARCPNGPGNTYPRAFPPDVSKGNDELEQFVLQGSQRIERIRKRYSVAEDDGDDPTFGFARRPSVRGVQSRLPPAGAQYLPSDMIYDGAKQSLHYVTAESSAQGPMAMRPRTVAEHEIVWGRSANWRPGEQGVPVYCAPGIGPNRSQAPLPVHRASVAFSELPGCSTLPHTKSHSDTRYHSYAENIYNGSQTLPHKRWQNVDPRTCVIPGNTISSHSIAQHQMPMMPGPGVNQPTLQVPPHTLSVTSDERGVPEGASSSPKVSSDSLYHGPLPEIMEIGAAHKDDGVIYYSMNV